MKSPLGALLTFVPAMGRPAIPAVLCVLLLFAGSSRSLGQSVIDGPWSGQAQCQITIQGPGYSHQETQTWTLNGAAPTIQGAMRVFPATWSVKGQGSFQRSQGSQTYQAQWTTNASLPNAPIAIFARASDRKLLIKSWHAQLRSAGGVTGTQQVTINGVPQTPGTISLEAFEWQFPGAEGVGNSTSFSGSNTIATNGAVGPMQPGGSQGTAQCSWQFAAGAGTVPTTPGSTTSTTGTLPIATTGAASSNATTTADITGSVNPNGSDTYFVFAYGTSSTLSGVSKTTSVHLGSGTTPVGLSYNLTGLTAGTTYYYQVQATNSAGTAAGDVKSFTTTSTVGTLPIATTEAASSNATTTATISASANPNGSDTHIVFAYGTSSTLSGASKTPSLDIGSGPVPVGISEPLAGLTAGTTYYYQVQATNSAGTANGDIKSFTTTSTAGSNKKASAQAPAESCSPPINPDWGTYSPKCVHRGDQNVALTLTAPTGNYLQTTVSVQAGDGVSVSRIQLNSPTSLTIFVSISSTATLGPRALWLQQAGGNEAAQSPFFVILPPLPGRLSQGPAANK